MTPNTHFETAKSWIEARSMLTFQPVEPSNTAGRPLESLRIHVRDHKLRELAMADRTLEAHYGAFVLSQQRTNSNEARRLAMEVSYGRDARQVQVAQCEGRLYELGPEPSPDDPNDIDGRSPAVVCWHDADMFFLIASDEMSADELIKIANSMGG